MKRVTGIGGIFFKTKDPQKTKDWYSKHLGIKSDEYGATFSWLNCEKPDEKGYTVWSPFKEDTEYFAPGKSEFMINYRVENLIDLLKELKKEGVTVIDKIEEESYGKFGWIVDPDGNKIELWEPGEDFD